MFLASFNSWVILTLTNKYTFKKPAKDQENNNCGHYQLKIDALPRSQSTK